MKTIENRARRSRMRLAAALAGLLVLLAAAWSVLGFYALPRWVQNELPRLVAEQNGHRARIADIRFNPFTLQADLKGVALDDAAGRAVLGFESAHVGLAWSSLPRRAWVLS